MFALALGSDSLAQLTGMGIVFLLLLALWQYYRQEGSAAPVNRAIKKNQPDCF